MTSAKASPPTAVVLMSGGLDSTTLLAEVVADGFRALPLIFRYGQRHEVEVAQAIHIARRMSAAAPLVLDLPYAQIGGSSLLGAGEIPAEPVGGAGAAGIPSTYVPARNLVFLSVAVAVAEARGAGDIFIGVNALDYSGYPDCRPAFIEAFAEVARLGTKLGVESSATAIRVHAPFIALRKADIIRRGLARGVDYAQTISCYDADPSGRACGRCESCGLRRRGFAEVGILDPTRYRPASV
ncbi:MAG: 7-cyano-7-deazaguanine synthase QueC [Planctomycetota bacterium]